jgi:hypothetical protein
VLVEHDAGHLKIEKGDEVFLTLPGTRPVDSVTVSSPSRKRSNHPLRRRSFSGESDTCAVLVADEPGAYRYWFQVGGSEVAGKFTVGGPPARRGLRGATR